MKSAFAMIALLVTPLATATVLSPQAAHAERSSAHVIRKSAPPVDKLLKINAKSVDCDELKNVAWQNTLIQSAGQIVAAEAVDCFQAHDQKFDFFDSRGLFIVTRDGLCNVWSCEPRRDNGGRSSS